MASAPCTSAPPQQSPCCLHLTPAPPARLTGHGGALPQLHLPPRYIDGTDAHDPPRRHRLHLAGGTARGGACGCGIQGSSIRALRQVVVVGGGGAAGDSRPTCSGGSTSSCDMRWDTLERPRKDCRTSIDGSGAMAAGACRHGGCKWPQMARVCNLCSGLGVAALAGLAPTGGDTWPASRQGARRRTLPKPCHVCSPVTNGQLSW